MSGIDDVLGIEPSEGCVAIGGGGSGPRDMVGGGASERGGAGAGGGGGGFDGTGGGGGTREPTGAPAAGRTEGKPAGAGGELCSRARAGSSCALSNTVVASSSSSQSIST